MDQTDKMTFVAEATDIFNYCYRRSDNAPGKYKAV